MSILRLANKQTFLKKNKTEFSDFQEQKISNISFFQYLDTNLSKKMRNTYIYLRLLFFAHKL